MINPTFLFYDYETFGKRTSLDKPVQFAGMRTDSFFNLIEKPYLIYCQPPSDYIPQPEAVIITGITPQIAFKYGIIEAHFAKYINKIFTIPYTCIVGYNNLRFDDELTRNIFYRNFYDSYSWSWNNGNSRLDLLNIIRTCYFLRPEGIEWPKNEKGLVSFRLKEIAKANKIFHKKAHDALSDVFATVEIAKLIKQKQPKLFNFIFNYRCKKQLINLINNYYMKLLINISNNKNDISWIVPISWHPNNSNILVSVDLSGRIDLLFDLSDDSLQEHFLKNKNINNDIKIPIKFIYINKCPILVPVNTLRSQDIIRLNINYNYYMNNLFLLRKSSFIKNKIINLCKKDKFIFSLKNDVDQQLYAGFFNESDRIKMNIIKKTKPENLSKIKFKFHDPRIEKLLFRYKARNFPNILNKYEQKKWFEHKLKVFNNEKIEKFLLELKILSYLNKDKKDKLIIIQELHNYINQITEFNNVKDN